VDYKPALLFPCLFLLFFFSLSPLSASDDLTYTSELDWEGNTLTVRIEHPIAANSTGLFKARSVVEERVKQQFPYILMDVLSSLHINSTYIFEDYLKEDPDLMEEVFSIAEKSVKTSSVISRNLDSLVVTYKTHLFPTVGAVFVQHKTPLNLPVSLDWVPSTEFTGVVIYMQGEYPVHGEPETKTFVPSLFPRIYDEYMTLILSEDMMDPTMLKYWGVFQYTDSFDEEDYRERIGKKPLRIIGKGLFGKAAGNILISEEAAKMLLYNDHNRSLLKEGRMLLIWNGPKK